MEGPAIDTVLDRESSLGIHQWNNIENMSTFAEVMIKSQVYCF